MRDLIAKMGTCHVAPNAIDRPPPTTVAALTEPMAKAVATQPHL